MESLEKSAEKVTAMGGKTLGPKIDIGGEGSLMHIQDSEGNLIAMWQAAPKK